MALVTADRVLETSTTTGTGAFTLAAAVAGYRRFSAVCSTSDTCYYTIVAVDANGNPSGDWETGLGTYSSANTLTRTTPAASTNGGAAVNFAAGTKYVFITATAGQLGTFQPLDSDLTAIAALTTASLGRSVLTAAALSDFRALGLQVQAVPSTQSGTSYTAVLGDAGGYIQFTSASAVAFTIPANGSVAYPTGTVITIEQNGAGTVTLTPDTGVTLRSRGSLLNTGGQYAVVQVKKVATNTWTVIGDVA